MPSENATEEAHANFLCRLWDFERPRPQIPIPRHRKVLNYSSLWCAVVVSVCYCGCGVLLWRAIVVVLYDLTIGTSAPADYTFMDAYFKVPPFQPALILFGGVDGLEALPLCVCSSHLVCSSLFVFCVMMGRLV